MRRNNFERMTIVEQLNVIREDICAYACKYREIAEDDYKDPLMQKVYLQRFCKDCPITKVAYRGE